MRRRRPSSEELLVLKSILEYQFNKDIASALLPEEWSILVDVTGKGRIRNVYVGEERVLTLRPNDGLFSLSLYAGRIIVNTVRPPLFRVIIRGDREIQGSVLVRDVIGGDEHLRPGDEVVVVDREDNVIGVGRLRIPLTMLEGLDRGEVVRVRRRAK